MSVRPATVRLGGHVTQRPGMVCEDRQASVFVAPASLVLRSQQHPWLRSAPSWEGATEPTVDPLHIAPGPCPRWRWTFRTRVLWPALSASPTLGHMAVLRLFPSFVCFRSLISPLGAAPNLLCLVPLVSLPALLRAGPRPFLILHQEEVWAQFLFLLLQQKLIGLQQPWPPPCHDHRRVTRKHFQAVPTLKMLPRPRALSSSSLALLFKSLYWEIYYGQWG